jgi:hypothetical protein
MLVHCVAHDRCCLYPYTQFMVCYEFQSLVSRGTPIRRNRGLQTCHGPTRAVALPRSLAGSKDPARTRSGEKHRPGRPLARFRIAAACLRGCRDAATTLPESTIASFALFRTSTWRGMRDAATPRNLAMLSRSAKSKASTWRTAIRRHMKGASAPSQSLRSGGAHPESWSKSSRTIHGLKQAALLYPVIRSRRCRLPFLP